MGRLDELPVEQMLQDAGHFETTQEESGTAANTISFLHTHFPSDQGSEQGRNRAKLCLPTQFLF
jgi:hypothetical protein